MKLASVDFEWIMEALEGEEEGELGFLKIIFVE